MNHYKQLYENCSSEYLLEKRALGDDLADDAHAAIEAIFADRGEQLPPKPSRPVLSTDITTAPNRTAAGAKTLVVVFLCLLALGFAKALAHTWVGLVISAVGVIYLLVDRVRITRMSPEQQQEETLKHIADRDRLNPLMLASAEGDIARAKELVTFGQDVNVRSLAGTTALMYAARNGNTDVVAFLLSQGADSSVRSEKGSTALSLARQFGHKEVERLLQDKGAYE